MRLSWFKD